MTMIHGQAFLTYYKIVFGDRAPLTVVSSTSFAHIFFSLISFSGNATLTIRNILRKKKAHSWLYWQNCSLLEVMTFWWNPTLIMIFFISWKILTIYFANQTWILRNILNNLPHIWILIQVNHILESKSSPIVPYLPL